MAQTVTNASPATVGIPYTAPATQYYDATVSWQKPGSAYRMMGLQLAFTTINSGYWVYVTHRVSGETKAIGTYYASETGGEKAISLPASAWKAADGDSLTLRFRRPRGNAQTYSRIRLIVTYESIADPSTASAASAIAGEAQTVNITNTDSTVTHAVTWAYGSESGGTFTELVSSGAQEYGAATRSPAWAVPAASLAQLYSANPNRTTIPGRITVQTRTDEGTVLGSVTVEAELTIPGSSETRPNLSVSVSAEQDAVADAMGAAWVQDHTVLLLTPTAAGRAGASLSGILAETPDGTAEPQSGGTVRILMRTAGSYPLTVTATDSRGYTTTWTMTLTVTACAAPAITALSAERCDAEGNADDEGAYLSVAATARVTAAARVAGWTYSLSRTGSSAPADEGTLTDGAGIIGGSLDAESTYTLRITVTDSLGQSATAEEAIGSAIYTIHRMAGGRGVAFGKVSERYGVEVNEDWPLYAHGREILELLADAAHPVGSVILTALTDWDPNEAWPWTRWVRIPDAGGAGYAVALSAWVRVEA